MNSTRVKRDELLKVLRDNRDKHVAVFNEALRHYRDSVIMALEQMLKDARAGKRVSSSIGLIQPMDQTREYDRAIRMLEMNTQEEVELDATSFAQLVMDQWRWMDQFADSSRSYLSMASLHYFDGKTTSHLEP